MLTSQKVSWHGQRGMKRNQLLPKMKTLLQTKPAPDMLFIHLGGNDLVTTHLGKLTKQAQGDVRTLAKLCPETILIWSDVLPRIRYRGAVRQNKVEKHAKHSIHPWEHMSERLEESRSDTPKYNGTQISNLGPMECTWTILEMTSWSKICTTGSAVLRTTQGYWNSPFHTNPLDSHL